METIYVGFKLSNSSNSFNSSIILRFQKLSVDRAMEIMSPTLGIFNTESRVMDYKSLFNYAIKNETRFVWEEEDGSPTILDYDKQFGMQGWRVLASTLMLFILTGEVMSDNEIIFTGSLEEIKKNVSKVTEKHEK